MKKSVKFFAIALSVFAFAACNNQGEEKTTDSIAPVDSVCDTLACQDTTNVDTATVAEANAAANTKAATKTSAKKEVKKNAVNETTTKLKDGTTATTNNAGKMQKANAINSNETTTLKDGTTTITNNTGKMKRKTN